MCSVPAGTKAKTLHVRLVEGEGLVLYMIGWWVLLQRLKHHDFFTSRNRNKFCVPEEEIRQMASDAAKSRDPVRRRHLRKIARKARREFEAGRAVLPRGKDFSQKS